MKNTLLGTSFIFPFLSGKNSSFFKPEKCDFDTYQRFLWKKSLICVSEKKSPDFYNLFKQVANI